MLCYSWVNMYTSLLEIEKLSHIFSIEVVAVLNNSEYACVNGVMNCWFHFYFYLFIFKSSIFGCGVIKYYFEWLFFRCSWWDLRAMWTTTGATRTDGRNVWNVLNISMYLDPNMYTWNCCINLMLLERLFIKSQMLKDPVKIHAWCVYLALCCLSFIDEFWRTFIR